MNDTNRIHSINKCGWLSLLGSSQYIGIPAILPDHFYKLSEFDAI